MRRILSCSCCPFALVLATSWAFADADSRGRFGINVPDVGLDGSGIDIGQVEMNRPGDPDFDTNASLYHSSVNPTQVYWRTPGTPTIFDASNGPNASTEVSNHAIQVAGIMISTDATLKGVAPGANLYAIGDNATGPDFDPDTAESIQYLITRPGTDIRVVNMSFLNEPNVLNYPLDGSALLSRFVDWSTRTHDILYVISGYQRMGFSPNVIPSDSFNGMTIAYSEKVGTTWRRVGSGNNFSRDAAGARTSVSLLAPGHQFRVPIGGSTDVSTSDPGSTSHAAPHVTGTVALLQQHAALQMAGNANARQNEVMKAVLLNSADKIEGILGMERTVLKQNGTDTWFNSSAHTSFSIPLDIEMGAGHLNAKRALQQFSPGQFAPGNVPLIGWDYNFFNDPFDPTKYVFNQQLSQGDYVSITLTWDREWILDELNAPFDGKYDPGDNFINDYLEDLDLYLLPAGSTNVNQAVWESTSRVQNVEHLFAEIPQTGNYEFWVHWPDPTGFGSPFAFYAIAWWAGPVVPPGGTSSGDFNGDGEVDEEDYNIWRGSFGTDDAMADANGNGVVDAADFVIWRKNFGTQLGSGSGLAAAVSEPTALASLMAALSCLLIHRRR